MIDWIKSFYCKHQNYIWVRPIEKYNDPVTYPAKICQDCKKLTWVTQCGKRAYFIKPVEISKSRN